jgi:two-component system, chemotaxis family, protein-glutamate methylesterase/glutaminase
MPAARGKIRVLVVDDSAFVRRSIVKMYQGSDEVEVVDVAGNGEEAVALTQRLRPDVVTLDVQMPLLDGLGALERIMRECPTAVVMFSSLTGRGGEKTLKALDLGAVDFIDKSNAGGFMNLGCMERELTAKIRVAARVDVTKLGREDTPKGAPKEAAATGRQTEVVAIGTSTGGPPALLKVLGELPETLSCPILIVQHMPQGFTASLADRLNRHSALQVKEAADGDLVVPGGAYIAPAGSHMRLKRKGGKLQVSLDPTPDGSLHRPSVDALFDSVAAACGARALAVVLTGMGKDGSLGAQAVKNSGGRVVVESAESAVVFGMPKAVLEAVEVDAMVPLKDVAGTIVRMV